VHITFCSGVWHFPHFLYHILDNLLSNIIFSLFIYLLFIYLFYYPPLLYIFYNIFYTIYVYGLLNTLNLIVFARYYTMRLYNTRQHITVNLITQWYQWRPLFYLAMNPVLLFILWHNCFVVLARKQPRVTQQNRLRHHSNVASRMATKTTSDRQPYTFMMLIHFHLLLLAAALHDSDI